MLKNKGHSIIELMVAIGIFSLLLALTLPDFNHFIIKNRVDNEISELHRLLLLSRNIAVNTGTKVTLCPLNNASECINNWQGELSVFIDSNNNKRFDKNSNERQIQVKEAIHEGDNLLYGLKRKAIVYSPTGSLSGLSNGTFRYCPKNQETLSRGLIVAISGRVYQSTNNNNGSADTNRNDKVINCK